MIHCIIADDEPLARQIIRQHLSHFPDWTVAKECINATEAWQALHEGPVQVIFLDIQMPGINGVDFVRSLKQPPLIIFTTAFANYAVEGFNLMAIDYLLKPITLERFKQAIARVHEKLQTPALSIKEVPAPGTPTPLASDHFFLKHDNKLLKINFDEVLLLEAQRDFTRICLQEKELLVSFHLKILEEMLPAQQFLRVHRSFIINKAKITHIEGNRITIKKREVPIGNNYKEQFMKALGLGEKK